MLYPEQGEWTEDEYLDLTDETNGRVEFTEGRLEFLPMPTWIHEELVRFLFFALHGFVEQNKLGAVYWNGIRVRVRPRKLRLPDVLFVHKDHYAVRHNRVWEGADLVVEVVSDNPKDRARDYEQKLADYAKAGIAEYWIVDPKEQVALVYRLAGEQYAIHGEFKRGQEATSALLAGFAIDVDALFAVIDNIPE